MKIGSDDKSRNAKILIIIGSCELVEFISLFYLIIQLNTNVSSFSIKAQFVLFCYMSLKFCLVFENAFSHRTPDFFLSSFIKFLVVFHLSINHLSR